jgi:hypothetical protein
LVDRRLTAIAAQRLPPRRKRGNPRGVKRTLRRLLVTRPHHANPPKPRPIAATRRSIPPP